MSKVIKPILATMPGPDPLWNKYVEDYFPADRGSIRDHLHMFRLSKGRKILLLNGSVGYRQRYRDLIFAILLKFKWSRTPVLIQDATWEPTSYALQERFPFLKKLLPIVARFVISLIDGPNVKYAVLSTSEVKSFPKTWGVDASRVVFQPFPNTLHEYKNIEIRDEGYLFSGGNSVRDYKLLEDALQGTDVPAMIATNWKPIKPLANVHFESTTHDKFMKLLAHSHAVVIPLRVTVRSAGQQSYLNAMGLGKPVIVTDVPGVRDYVIHGVTGIIIPPSDPTAMREAILHVMNPENADFYEEMGKRAKEDVFNRFTEEHFRHGLLYHAGVISREEFEKDKSPGSADSWL